MSLAGSIALFVVLAALSVGARAALWRERRRPVLVSPPSDEVRRDSDLRARRDIRSDALDAVSEAVLLVTPDGRVKDCNSTSLLLFDRHRAVMEGAYVSALRTLEYQGEHPLIVAEARNVWTGEAWIRQADGSVRLCLLRVVPIRNERGDTSAFVESYRDVLKDGVMGDELRDLLFGIRSEDTRIALAGRDPLEGINQELQELGVAFRDLDRVVREYERLLPSIAAQDPLAEAIAGTAVEVRLAAGSRDVPSLLAAIPGLLARLRASVNRLRGERGGAE
jgi:hypothetical protein